LIQQHYDIKLYRPT